MNATPASPNGIKTFRPLIIAFILINAGLFGARSLLIKYNISPDVLLGGNVVLFIATAVSFYFYFKSLNNDRPQAMVRMVYSGMFVKLALCLVSAFLYIMIAGKNVNKGGIIGSMVLYMLYTVMEVVILQKASKQKKNA